MCNDMRMTEILIKSLRLPIVVNFISNLFIHTPYDYVIMFDTNFSFDAVNHHLVPVALFHCQKEIEIRMTEKKWIKKINNFILLICHSTSKVDASKIFHHAVISISSIPFNIFLSSRCFFSLSFFCFKFC